MKSSNILRPQVSIIMPVYNVGKYIDGTLESIINQTFKNFELILVDDGSKDDSIERAKKKLSSSHVNWKIVSKENGGAASARNLGIEHATGEWIICPDSDDIFAPVMIERLVSEAIRTNVKCVATNYEPTDIEKYPDISFLEKSSVTYSSEQIKKLFLERKIQLISPGMLVHKSICSKVRYNVECPYDEDVYYVWEVLFSCDKMTFIDANYYLYLTRPGSTVHSLKPENYLKTSEAYAKLEKKLLENKPDEKKIIRCIYPKYKLGGLHVLAKTNSYIVFRKTVYRDEYRKGMRKLVFYPNIRLSIYALLYCISLRVFYSVSRGK